MINDLLIVFKDSRIQFSHLDSNISIYSRQLDFPNYKLLWRPIICKPCLVEFLDSCLFPCCYHHPSSLYKHPLVKSTQILGYCFDILHRRGKNDSVENEVCRKQDFNHPFKGIEDRFLSEWIFHKLA